MKSLADPTFWNCYNGLPAASQQLVAKDYKLWQDNPHHPSLRFKKVHATKPIYSARCGIHYRALGVRDGDTMIWFWVGTHAEYDRLLKQL